VSMSGENKDLILKETQIFIQRQMQTLQTEIIKYSEVINDNRKTNEAKAAIEAQLKLEQDHCRRLHEQIRVLQQANEDLEGRSIQLEYKLSDLQNSTCERDLNSRISEQELSDLRQQLKQTNDNLISANAKTEKVEKLRKELETRSEYFEVRALSSNPC